jgi:hypothetical protein
MFKSFGLVGLALFLLVIGSWIGNLNKLLDCDFASPYKCEVVHAIGIIPVASVITVWFDTEIPKVADEYQIGEG